MALWGGSYEDFDLQSSKASINFFFSYCFLKCLFMDLRFVREHIYNIQKIFAEINFLKSLQEF